MIIKNDTYKKGMQMNSKKKSCVNYLRKCVLSVGMYWNADRNMSIEHARNITYDHCSMNSKKSLNCKKTFLQTFLPVRSCHTHIQTHIHSFVQRNCGFSHCYLCCSNMLCELNARSICKKKDWILIELWVLVFEWATAVAASHSHFTPFCHWAMKVKSFFFHNEFSWYARVGIKILVCCFCVRGVGAFIQSVEFRHFSSAHFPIQYRLFVWQTQFFFYCFPSI